jgi:hypothetical protein
MIAFNRDSLRLINTVNTREQKFPPFPRMLHSPITSIKHVAETCLCRELYASQCLVLFNPLTPNDPYSGRTAPLTSKVAFYI